MFLLSPGGMRIVMRDSSKGRHEKVYDSERMTYWSNTLAHGGDGAGYDFWLGQTFNLGIHAELSRQTYSDEDAPDDSQIINVYVSFYWL